MKLISHENGKVVRLFVGDEIRPTVGLYLPDVIGQIAERYRFAVIPSVPDTQKAGAIFQQGKFVTPTGEIPIPMFGSYSDGAMVSCFNTDDAQIILEDFIAWVWSTFKLREPRTPPRTFFESAVVVEFDGPLSHIMHGFERLKRTYDKAVRETYQQDLPAKFSRIAIGADPLGHGSFFKPDFLVERRLGRPYSEERYFSMAPLRTSDHLELLQEFERELSK